MKDFKIALRWKGETWIVQGEWEDSRNDPAGRMGVCEIESVTYVDRSEVYIHMPKGVSETLDEFGLGDATYQALIDRQRI